MGIFFNTALLVLKKDFAIELKSREIVYTTLLFALSCILIFSLTFVVEGQPLAEAASGIVWIAIAFSGTLALGRTFERERYSETLRALLLAPAPRAAIYVGKLLGMVTLLVAAEALIVPLVSVLFQANLLAQLPLLAPLLLLGTHRIRGCRHAVRRDARPRAHARCAAAHPVVSDHCSGHDCRSTGHLSAAAGSGRARRWRSCGSRSWHRLTWSS